MSDSLKSRVDQFEEDVDLTHQLVHGDDAASVDTDAGPVRSFAHLQKDLEADLNAAAAITETGQNREAAETARQGAETAEQGAEQARDAAFVNAEVYASVADGLSAVADAEQFQVVEGDDIVRYKRLDASTEQEVARYPAVGNGLDRVVLGSKNLFNPDDVEYGYWWNSFGNKSYNASRATTPKMPVGGASYIAVSGLPDGGWLASSYVVRFFDIDDNYLDDGSAKEVSTGLVVRHMVAEVPAAAETFVLSLEVDNIPDRLQIEFADYPTEYEPGRLLTMGAQPYQFDQQLYRVSDKNLYSGDYLTSKLLTDGSLYNTSNTDAFVSVPIPVEFGKYYTLSGLRPDYLDQRRNVVGFSTDELVPVADGVKEFPDYTTSTHTIYIDHADVNFIMVTLARRAGATEADIQAMEVQVEEGQTATTYDPYRVPLGVREARELAGRDTQQVASEVVDAREKERFIEGLGNIAEFTEIPQANDGFPALVAASPIFRPGPWSLVRSITASGVSDGASMSFYKAFTVQADAEVDIFARFFVMDSAGGAITPRTQARVFDVPSGQFDNENPPASNFPETYSLAGYCHPSVAYDASGVAGWEYWMIASVLPGIGQDGKAAWEDEDLFVSHDGETWYRVQSLYEDAKSYTAPTLRLPPTDAATTGRIHGFLPIYEAGDTLEISSPAHNGNPEVDRQTVTLDVGFKHDPAILIDGGYVYTYHSFHLPYGGSGVGEHRFLVCVRTSDGVNWEAVRPDGSTLALDSPAATRELFTKDDQGRYNYLNYAYSTGRSNPEVIKYGAGDYEMLYGSNHSQRFAGITPYDFDFTTALPMENPSSGNHPGAFYDGSRLYLFNQNGMYVSDDRGETFTKYPYAPLWAGMQHTQQYKKCACVGENGSVKVFDTVRYWRPSPIVQQEDQTVITNRDHMLVQYRFDSVAELVGYAENGLDDAYLDLQVSRVSADGSEREVINRVYQGTTGAGVDNGWRVDLRKIIAGMNVAKGDRLQLWVTVTARAGASIRFDSLSIREAK